MNNTIQEILKAEATAIQNIPVTGDFEKAINLIEKSVHQNKGKVITSGVGKAGQIALNIATTLSSTGSQAIFVHAADAQHGDLGIIGEDDVLLLISNSGKTNEIVKLVELANNLHEKKLPIIVITAQKESPLAQLANAVLETGNPQEVCPLGLAPTTSTTVMNVIGNTLVVLMMKRIKLSKKEYAKRHHGGYLGEKAKQ